MQAIPGRVCGRRAGPRRPRHLEAPGHLPSLPTAVSSSATANMNRPLRTRSDGQVANRSRSRQPAAGRGKFSAGGRIDPCLVYPRSMTEEGGSAFTGRDQRFGQPGRVTGVGSDNYPALVDSCRNFVTMKYRIDDFLDTIWQRFRDYEAVAFYGLDWLTALGQDAALDDQSWLVSRCPDFFKLEPKPYLRYSLGPDRYVAAALPPYSGRSAEDGKFILTNVDPSLVVGSTYHYRDGFSNEEERNATLDRLNDQVGSRSPYSDCAYVSIGTLPLCLAHEGKNRVRAFLEAGRTIRAWVGPARFPEAESLQLRHIKEPESPYADQTPIYLIFDLPTDKFQVIPLPSITIPLLESYGVSWGAAEERGSWGGEFAWNMLQHQRQALHRLARGFNLP
jgi:hypothetical protein